MKIQNIDKYGNCIICHKFLIRNIAVGGQVIGTWHPDKDEAYMLLNNGSRMPISICKPCKASTDLTDPNVHTQIMEAVNNGWELEIDHMKKNPHHFKDFTPVKEATLRSFYKSLSIAGYDPHHKVGVQ